MDISKRLPDNLPANWDELQQEVRALLEKYALKHVSLCVDMVDCERSDVLVEKTLRTLLDQFPSIKRIRLFYDADEVSYYRIRVDVDPDSQEIEKIVEAQEALRNEVRPRIVKDVNGWFDFVESEEKFQMYVDHISAQVVVIER